MHQKAGNDIETAPITISKWCPQEMFMVVERMPLSKQESKLFRKAFEHVHSSESGC